MFLSFSFTRPLYTDVIKCVLNEHTLTGSVLSFLSSAILRMLLVMSGEARPKLTSRGQPTTVLRREEGTLAYKMEDLDGQVSRGCWVLRDPTFPSQILPL